MLLQHHSNPELSGYILLIWKLLTVWLIVDCLNGFCEYVGIKVPFSQIYKFGILILITPVVLRIKNQILLYSLILIYLSLFIINLGLHNNSLSTSIASVFKPILTIGLYFFFSISYKYLSIWNVIRLNILLYKYSIITIFINLILGVLGYGFRTYEGFELATKGFFIAGNELGGVFCAIMPISIYYIKITYNSKALYCYSLLIIIASVLIGTKSVIIVSIISCSFIIYYGSSKAKKRFIILVFIVVAIILSLIFEYLTSNFNTELIERWLYFYDDGGLARLILSGRDGYWLEKQKIFYSAPIMTQLVGLGGDITVERDQYDALLRNGYIGQAFMFIMFSYFIIRSLKYKNINKYMPCVLFTNIILIAMAMIAGHIFYSGMASIYISKSQKLNYTKPHGQN